MDALRPFLAQIESHILATAGVKLAPSATATYRHSPKKPPDLALGAARSTNARFFFPVCLDVGIHLFEKASECRVGMQHDLFRELVRVSNALAQSFEAFHCLNIAQFENSRGGASMLPAIDQLQRSAMKGAMLAKIPQ